MFKSSIVSTVLFSSCLLIQNNVFSSEPGFVTPPPSPGRVVGTPILLMPGQTHADVVAEQFPGGAAAHSPEFPTRSRRKRNVENPKSRTH